MRKKLNSTEDVDRAEFLRFMIANLDYNHEFVRL